MAIKYYINAAVSEFEGNDGKSKKAFEHNIKAELHAGKPQPQALAVAYSVKRKAKKMAEGGDITAKTEKRPMPEQTHDDSKEVMMNHNKKALKDSSWTDTPTERQATAKPRIQPIKHPRMVPSDTLSTRLFNYEDELERHAAPASPKEQPEHDMDEEGADRHGPMTPSLKMKMMAKGGKINNVVSMKDAEEDEVEHPAHLEEDDDQMTMPVDEFMAGHAKLLAEGGLAHEMDEQPEEEAEEERHNSIAAAIMAKKKHQAMLDSDSDEDHMAMMAEGGQIDLDENAEEQPNSYYHQNEDVALKENYDSDMDDVSQPMDSNEHADSREADEENKHDMISVIRRRMKSRRQF